MPHRSGAGDIYGLYWDTPRQGNTLKFDPNNYRRKSIYLKGYDFSHAGGYFITIITYRREYLFGEVVCGGMQVNAIGKIVHEEWFRSAKVRKEIHLFEDEFVIMPNHIHGIVWIDTVGADGVRPVNNALANHAGAHRPRMGKPAALHLPLVSRR